MVGVAGPCACCGCCFAMCLARLGTMSSAAWHLFLPCLDLMAPLRNTATAVGSQRPRSSPHSAPHTLPPSRNLRRRTSQLRRCPATRMHRMSTACRPATGMLTRRVCSCVRGGVFLQLVGCVGDQAVGQRAATSQRQRNMQVAGFCELPLTLLHYHCQRMLWHTAQIKIAGTFEPPVKHLIQNAYQDEWVVSSLAKQETPGKCCACMFAFQCTR
jgi:hypothetical protein